MTVLPEVPGLFANAQTCVPACATLSVDPPFNAGTMGGQIIITILGTVNPGGTSVLGYDISLDYNNNALSVASIDFDTTTVWCTPQIVGPCTQVAHDNVLETCVTVNNPAGCTVPSDAISSVRYAVAGLGGASVTLNNSPMLIVTFNIISSTDSDLIIDPSVVVNIHGNPTTLGTVCTPLNEPNCDETVNNGTFLIPPHILIMPPNASITSPTERVRHIHKASDQPVHMMAFIMLDPNAARPGFGGVTFDVFDPSGGDTPITSSIVFLFPGDSATVTGDYFFPFILGPYTVTVTPLQCPVPTACSAGAPTVLGGNSFGQPPPFFKVNP